MTDVYWCNIINNLELGLGRYFLLGLCTFLTKSDCGGEKGKIEVLNALSVKKKKKALWVHVLRFHIVSLKPYTPMPTTGEEDVLFSSPFDLILWQYCAFLLAAAITLQSLLPARVSLRYKQIFISLYLHENILHQVSGFPFHTLSTNNNSIRWNVVFQFLTAKARLRIEAA